MKRESVRPEEARNCHSCYHQCARERYPAVAVALDEYEAGIKTRGGGIGNVSQPRHNAFDFSRPLDFVKRAAGLRNRVGGA